MCAGAPIEPAPCGPAAITPDAAQCWPEATKSLFMRRWLDGSAYRIDLGLVPFLAAGFGAIAVAIAKTAFHAVQVADPARSRLCDSNSADGSWLRSGQSHLEFPSDSRSVAVFDWG
jgi:hypothetical protein